MLQSSLVHDQLLFLLLVVADLVQDAAEELAAGVVAISCRLRPAQHDPVVGRGHEGADRESLGVASRYRGEPLAVGRMEVEGREIGRIWTSQSDDEVL